MHSCTAQNLQNWIYGKTESNNNLTAESKDNDL